MFNPGDIVKFVDRSHADPWFNEHMKCIKDEELFIVKKASKSGVTISTPEYTNLTLFSYRFKLIAKKTKFGYIVME